MARKKKTSTQLVGSMAADLIGIAACTGYIISRDCKNTSNKEPVYHYGRWDIPEIDGNLMYHTQWGTEDHKEILDRLTYTLDRLGIACTIYEAKQGATLFRFTIRLDGKTKVNQLMKAEKELSIGVGAKVSIVEDDCKLYIEVPKTKKSTVYFGDMVNSKEFKAAPNTTLCIGMDNDLNPVIYDLETAKHILIAGQTGSGKSVLMHNLILSLLMKNTPNQIHLHLIDPKKSEFSFYATLPHVSYINDENSAVALLEKLGAEMDMRYSLFESIGCRDIETYNKTRRNAPMRREVVFIDELSDLILKCGKKAENGIVRLAQKARACGIHLIIATQYPVAKVVTGLIKQNMPTKICLSVTTGVASRVALDMNGGEKLLGNGDMLFKTDGSLKPMRLQGGLVSEEEIRNIVNSLLSNITYIEPVKKRKLSGLAIAGIVIGSLVGLASFSFLGIVALFFMI